VEHVLRCAPSPYQAALASLVAAKFADDRGGAAGAKGINNTVMELRNIANHPLLRCVLLLSGPHQRAGQAGLFGLLCTVSDHGPGW
jgi:hypothetical protein